MRITTQVKKRMFNCLTFLCLLFSITTVQSQCPTVTNPNQSFCDLQSPNVNSLQAVNNGGGIRWYATATSTTPLSGTTGLVNGATYFADDNTGICGIRQSVTVSIFSAPTGQNFQGVCVENASDAKVSNLVANGNNIRWYLTATGGAPLAPSTVLINNTFYFASQTNPNTGCETSRLSVYVRVGVVPVPTGNPFQEFCNDPNNPPTVANLVASGTNSWYLTPTSGAALDPATPLVSGQSYYASSVVPPCESQNRFEVEVNLVAPNNSGTNGNRAICVNEISTTQPFDLFDLLGGTPDNTGVWTGPLSTSNGFQGTVDVSTLTLAGSPYVFTYKVTSALCPQSSSTVTITVLPLPTATISSNTTICSGSNAVVTFNGTPNATVTYNVNNGADQTIQLNSSGVATVSNSYTESTVYNLVSVASQGTPSCINTLTGSITITVLPLPTVTIADDATICSGDNATVTFTGTPNATVVYNINGGANQTIVLNGSGSALISNVFSATTTYNLVSVTSSGTPSCTQMQDGSATITVLPLPTATIASSTTICSGDIAVVTFTGTPNATVTYTINGGANQTIVLDDSGNAVISNMYTSNTTFSLVSISSATTPVCNKNLTGSVTITVIPLPVVSISTNTPNICPNGTATVTFTGTPNATVTYSINGDSNQTIVLNASGIATITNSYSVDTTFNLISVATSGTPVCSQLQSGSVTINIIPLPTVTIESDVTICSGDNASIVFNGTPNATVTYTINGGVNQTIILNGSGTASIGNVFTNTTTYSLVSVSTAGTPSCSQPQSGSATVTVLPLPNVVINTATPNICPNDSVTVNFTGTPDATVTYNINGGSNQSIILDSTGNASITDTLSASTQYNLVNITSATTPSCTRVLTGSLNINVIPLPTVTIGSDVTICSGNNATVTFTGTPNATVTYTVNGGSNQTIVLNTSGSASITSAYTVETVFELVSASTSGTPSCSQPQTGSVTISILPLPTVTVLGDTTICSGENAVISFIGTPNATVTYNINGGVNQTILLDNSGEASISNTYASTAVLNLVSVASASTPICTQPQSGTVTITVIQLPTATISTNSPNVCPEGVATITFTGTPNATVTYNVDGGSDQTIVLNNSGTASIVNNFSASTTYNLVSAITSGSPTCSQLLTGSVTITVIQLPTVSIASDNTICSGDTATITFTGTPNAIVTYTVNGGSNQTITLNNTGSASIVNVFTATSTFSLVSAATATIPSCSQPQTGTVTITVLPLPTAAISTTTPNICPNNSATVNITGTPNATVTYTVNGGGNQTIVLDGAGNASITNTYMNTTQFNLVSVSSPTNPICINPLTGNVTITVIPLPTASIASDTTICSGNSATVNFTGTPNATVTYSVNGGSNQTVVLNGSGIASITNTYTTTTTFNLVSVATATTPSCSQPQTGSATITVVPLPVVTMGSTTTICFGNSATVSFTGTPNAIVTYNVNGGSNQTITLNGSGSGSVTAAYTATTTFNLVSVATSGAPTCSVPQSGTVVINVLPLPTVTFNTTTPNVCPNGSATITFTGTPNATVTYNVNGGSNQTIVLNSSGSASITTTYAATTTYNLVSIASATTPICTQTQSGSVTINVIPLPTVTISTTTPNVCSNVSATVTFNGTPNATVTYTVNGGSNQTIVLNNLGSASISSVYTSNTTYSLVSVASATTPSCSQSQVGSVTFNVTQAPNAGTNGSATLCINSPSVNLFTLLGGTPQAGGTWSPAMASGTGVFNPSVDAAGIYTYTVAGTGPCANTSASVTINIDPIPNAGTYTGSQTICNSDGTLDLTSFLNNFQTTNGTWTNASGQTVTNPINITNFTAGVYKYTYTITNVCGSDSETIEFRIKDCFNIYVPDGFSPNGDGINDEFVIANLVDLFPNFRLEIFNRYGSSVYKGDKNSPNWNGTTTEGGVKFGNNVLPVGVYFYVLELNDGIRKPIQGRVYLNR